MRDDSMIAAYRARMRFLVGLHSWAELPPDVRARAKGFSVAPPLRRRVGSWVFSWLKSLFRPVIVLWKWTGGE